MLVRLKKAVIVAGAQYLQTWRIISGRRRYLVAKQEGIPTVPAIEMKAVDGADYALTIGLNRFRSDNLVADLKAAAVLIAARNEDGDIRKMTGLTAPEIDRLRRIAASDPRIIQALADGRCKPSVAEAAAKLAPRRQKALMDQFAKRLIDPKVKLTGKDVAAVKDAIQANAVAALPASLFEVGPLPRPQPDLAETVSRLLDRFGEAAILNAIQTLKTQEKKAA